MTKKKHAKRVSGKPGKTVPAKSSSLQARLKAMRTKAEAEDREPARDSETVQHGQFYDELARILFAKDLFQKNSIVVALLVVCARCVIGHDRWVNMEDSSVKKALGLSRATRFRSLATLRDLGLLHKDRQPTPHHIKLNFRYFGMPDKRSQKGARFAQLYAKLARMIIDDQWAAKHPNSARILTGLIAALALHHDKAEKMYWIRGSSEQFRKCCAIGSNTWKPAMDTLLTGRNPIVIRHPSDRCLYAIRPDLVRVAGPEKIPPKDLEQRPPASRIIDLTHKIQRA